MAEQEATTTAQATTEAANSAQTATEQAAEAAKTETATTTETQAGEKMEEAKAAPPEKYELKLPEGSLLDPSTIEKISAYAKEKGLSNEAAQEVLERENAAVTLHHEAQMKQVEDIRNGWVKDAEVDTEIGGAAFKENAELAKRVVDRFGSEEFKKALNETGFGNHPEVLRTFVRIGKMMADDQLIHPKSQAPAQGESDIAAKMYPSMAPKQ